MLFSRILNSLRFIKPKIPLKKSGHVSATVSKIHTNNFTSTFSGGNSRSSIRLSGQRRCYHVDRNGVWHFERPLEFKEWLQAHINKLSFLALGSLGLGAYIYLNRQTVPYTNRKHFVFCSMGFEKWLGNIVYKFHTWGETILPAEDPTSVRVRLISENIINALYRQLDLPRGAKESELMKKDAHKESKSGTKHLEGMNWEVIVIEKSIVNAYCVIGGKIVIYTGLLELFKTDAEIATVIGHEVGHAVARHGFEGLTQGLGFIISSCVVEQFVPHFIVNKLWSFFKELPHSRRMELEADYIGLLLMASAGYDPRIAPNVYKRLNSTNDGEEHDKDRETVKKGLEYISTHPCGERRAMALAQDKVMAEALSLYEKSQLCTSVDHSIFFLS